VAPEAPMANVLVALSVNVAEAANVPPLIVIPPAVLPNLASASMLRVPPLTVVPPEYVFVAVEITTVLVLTFVSCKVPLAFDITPDKVNCWPSALDAVIPPTFKLNVPALFKVIVELISCLNCDWAAKSCCIALNFTSI
jgi:hypothetical protein